MENCISKLVDAGADIVTIHCSSNFRPKNAGLLKYIAGVTILTSLTDLEVKWIYERTADDIVKAFSKYSPNEQLRIYFLLCQRHQLYPGQPVEENLLRHKAPMVSGQA